MKNPSFLKHSILPIMLTLFVAVSTANAQEAAFCSRVVPLTQSTDDGGDNNKFEQAIVGNVIHIVWQEYVSQNTSKIYYRRSPDLGATWEDEKLLYETSSASYTNSPFTKLLAIDGNNIHIAISDYDYSDKGRGSLVYIRSVDAGVTFAEPAVLYTVDNYTSTNNSIIQAVNGKVAIAFGHSKKNIGFVCSTDGGTTFGEPIFITEGAGNSVKDMYFDGKQSIIVSTNNCTFASITNDFGKSFTTTKVSIPYSGTDENMGILRGDLYKPCIAKADKSIYIVMEGYDTDSTQRNTFLTKSIDNGVSFDKPITITTDDNKLKGNGRNATIAAKGDYVYICTLNGDWHSGPYRDNHGNNVVYYSSDKGNTFNMNDSYLAGLGDIPEGGSFYFMLDPLDDSGKSVFLLGKCHTYIHSSDGFQSIDDMFSYTSGYGYRYLYSNSYQIAIDENGMRHDFASLKLADKEKYDIYYSQMGKEPEPTNENMALDLTSSYNSSTNFNYAAIPYSKSTTFDSAMTAELWVKVDTILNCQLIYAGSQSTNYSTSFPDGWGICVEKNSWRKTIYIKSAMTTDKECIALSGEAHTIEPGIWHHVAMTYDANVEQLNNLKLYVDGVLVAEKPQVGIISMPAIKPIAISSAGYEDQAAVDNVRLWNRALSKEELVANMGKDIPENTDGLKANLTFNGTFKDISGNGNDAINLFSKLAPTEREIPVVDFELYQTMADISASNHSTNATSYQWDFGDVDNYSSGNSGKASSTLSSPSHEYTKPGEYEVTLSALNTNSKASASKSVTVHGLDKVEPEQAGNSGYVAIEVYGGGLSTAENTKVILRKEGEPDRESETLALTGKGILLAQIPVEGAAVGKWDVVVVQNGSEMVLPEVFTIVQAEEAEPWVNLSGRKTVLSNMWQTYTLSYGNKGNVDAYYVPIYLAITDHEDLEVIFSDFYMDVPDYANTLGIADDVERWVNMFYATP